MKSQFTVWFSNYDARRCKLFRAALTLKNEPWGYTTHLEEAAWWVVDETDAYDTEQLIAAYKQQLKKQFTPVIIILKDGCDNEYYDSWASLRVPMNFITFFKWMDGVIERGVATLSRDKTTHVEILKRFQGYSATSEFLQQATSYRPNDAFSDSDAVSSLVSMPAVTDSLLASASQSATPTSEDNNNTVAQNPQDMALQDASAQTTSVTNMQFDDSASASQQWHAQPFRLKTWPNVARYGTDYRLVLVLSKMLRGYVNWADIGRYNIDSDILARVLLDAAANGSLVYAAVPPALPSVADVASQTSHDAHHSGTTDVSSDAQLDTPEPLSGQNNRRSIDLFNSIAKFFKRA